MSTVSDDQTTTPPRDRAVALVADEAMTYVALRAGEDFARLRTRSRRYLATAAVLLLGAFAVTVALAGWAPGFLEAQVAGNINVGLLVAAGLIVLPAALSVVHLRYASRRLDPLAARIRESFEGSRR
ncbi:DUF485 domain-containing protein [Actinoplanes xinjiangensis]|uniref:Uncharacterized membrane protein (DUF485 family) n=1 Tax=Actinoplanes xinjiangensis TaxID=512350 RepID=A0A316EV11_9ACTN|nr:DUF485 domain-containing protein [Actinoplanes xinjiangensis]PWK36066.1 uncharacterized membrane protein (DUF485 family) [Actinoplanes xinjiangensis]GIF42932.1 hypothetical protein Axi01nite_72430 [Actinoplanes xinjiangensis]